MSSPKKDDSRPKILAELEDERLLKTHEVAHLLGIKPSTLGYWRHRSRRIGPPFMIIGRHARYPLRGLRRWIQERLSNPGFEKSHKDALSKV